MGAMLNSMGLAAAHLCRYDQAMGYYQDALAISRKLGQDGDAARVHMNLGHVAAELSQCDRALSYYEQALSVFRKLGLEKEAALTLNGLGRLSADMGQGDQALSYYEQAMTILRPLGSYYELGVVAVNTAEMYMSQGRLADAKTILGVYPDPVRLGRYELLAGDPARAVEEFQQAAVGVGRNASAQTASQIGLGLAREALGEWGQAAQAYGKAVELLEAARRNVTAAQRGSFYAANDYGFPRLEAYEGLVRVLHRLNREEEAFFWCEHTKARALVEALARVPYGTPVGLPPELRKQEDDLTNRVAALSKQLEEKPELRAALEPQLQPLQAELDSLIARLRREYPEYASMKYPEPLHANELALAPGEVLLAYEVTEPETLAFLVRGGKVEGVFEIKLKREELTKLVKEYRDQLERVEGPADLKGVDPRLSHRLYELLLKEPLAQIREGEQIVIVPDEAIGLLPLEGLVESLPAQLTWKEGAHGPVAQGVSYVGDRHSFSYWQSGTSLSMVRRLNKGGGGEQVLVVADPVFDVADARVAGTMMAQAPPQPAEGGFRLLREVRDSLGQEYGQGLFLRLERSGALVDRLEKLYGEKVKALVGTQAREGVLKRESLQQYGKVIFSTHGVLDGSLPWLRQPALVLSLVGNEEGEDGYLTMAEVMDLKLRAEVVGLMACESGAGRVISGEGVAGMGRAFQYAGARSVLASLWSVEDESTNLLAEAFLQAVSRGEDRAQALASARAHLRQSGYDHPFFWAPFTLIGEREQRPGASPN